MADQMSVASGFACLISRTAHREQSKSCTGCRFGEGRRSALIGEIPTGFTDKDSFDRRLASLCSLWLDAYGIDD